MELLEGNQSLWLSIDQNLQLEDLIDSGFVAFLIRISFIEGRGCLLAFEMITDTREDYNHLWLV